MRHARRTQDPPVFVDRSGRRRRLVKLAGACVGAALVAVLALMTAALSGASPINVPGFPDRNADAATSPPPPRPAPPGQPTPTAAAGASGATTTTTPEPTRRRVPSHTPPHPTPSKPK